MLCFCNSERINHGQSHKRSRKFKDSSDKNLRGQEKFSGTSNNAPSERRRDDRLRQNSKDWKYFPEKKHPGADPEELYGILRQELETAHGPHTSLDAVRLKQNLPRDLRGDCISWRHYLSEFRAGVNCQHPNQGQARAYGNVVRGPVPPVVHPPTPAIGANGRERRLWLDEVRKADQDHADHGPMEDPY